MNGFKLTESQEKALDLSSGKVVLAGAGSGKTTVLALRYVRILEEGLANPGEIVAVTFTRKAAAQLEGKVYENIEYKLQNDQGREEYWQRQLELFNGSRIGTIHNLCSTILRAYPFEAGVDPAFAVEGAVNYENLGKIRDYIQQKSIDHDPDLRSLLEVLEKRDNIEELLRNILSDIPFQNALEIISKDPVRVREYINLLHLKLNNIISGEMPGVVNYNYDEFIGLLKSLSRFALPLFLDDSSPPTRITYNELEQYALYLLLKYPHIRREINSSIKFLLIDEFQDTSNIQWEIFRLLVLRDDGEPDKNKLFLVGDEKQSIYGFRNANVTVVNQARELFSDDSATPNDDTNCIVLRENFRSSSNLINPLNVAFDRLLKPDNKQRYSFEADPQPLKVGKGDYPGVGNACEFAYGIEKPDNDIYRYIASRIRQELDKKTQTGDGFNASDIAILIPTRTKIFQLLKALNDYAIPFIVGKASKFFDNQEVRDQMNLLAALADSRDKIALTGVMRSPFMNLPDNVVAAIWFKKQSVEKAWSKLAEGNYPDEWPDNCFSNREIQLLNYSLRFWQDLQQKASQLTPSELLLYANVESGALAAYSVGRDGKRRIDNIYHLISRTRDMGETGIVTIREVSEHLDELAKYEDEGIDEDIFDSYDDCVRVLTIHGAKGLEFPFVILTDLDSSSTKTKERGNILVEFDEYYPFTYPILKDLVPKDDNTHYLRLMENELSPLETKAEIKRLMYVAATRAKDKLLLTTKIPLKKSKDIKASEMSHLFNWINAFDLRYDKEERSLTCPDDNILLTNINDEESKQAGLSPKSKIRNYLDPWPELEEGIDPSVNLSPPPEKDKLIIPITIFAGYVANPTDEKLLSLLDSNAGGDEKDEELYVATETGSGNNPETAVIIGNILHNIYQLFGPGCSWEEIKNEFSSLVRRFDIDQGEIPGIQKKIEQLLENGRKIGLHNYDLYALREFPIQLRLENVIMKGRIDLVVKNETGITVIDYKTNDIPKDNIEKLIAKEGYDHQLRLYGLALKKAWKVDSVMKKLVFIAPGVVYDVADIPGEEEKYRKNIMSLSTGLRSMLATVK